MGRLGTAVLLVLSTVAAGCGGGGDPVATTTPTATAITVTASGTGGFVPVGTSGVFISVPGGVIPGTTTLSTIPITNAAAVGAPFPGSDSFITGLQFGSPVSPILQAPGFQVPIAQPIPAGTSVAGFELGRSGWIPVSGVECDGTYVHFTTDHPGVYVFTITPSQ